MHLVRKIHLAVDKEREAILDGQSKLLNWLYNQLLATANELKDKYKSTQDRSIALAVYSERGLHDLIPELKKKYLFLQSIYSSPLKNAALRLSSSISDYQDSCKGKRSGKRVNWPKFRSWKGKWFSLLYDEPWKGYKVEGRELKIQLGVDAKVNRLSVMVQLAESLPSSEKESIKQLRLVK
jgi:putative transposase